MNLCIDIYCCSTIHIVGKLRGHLQLCMIFVCSISTVFNLRPCVHGCLNSIVSAEKKLLQMRYGPKKSTDKINLTKLTDKINLTI